MDKFTIDDLIYVDKNYPYLYIKDNKYYSFLNNKNFNYEIKKCIRCQYTKNVLSFYSISMKFNVVDDICITCRDPYNSTHGIDIETFNKLTPLQKKINSIMDW